MTARSAVPLPAVDEVRVTREGGELTVVAAKTVAADDPYLAGHFPGRPLYPGVFILETVRQAVAAVLDRPAAEVDIGAIGSVRYLAPAVAGVGLRFELTARPAPETGTVAVRARCARDDGAQVARMELELRYPDPIRLEAAAADAEQAEGVTGPALDQAHVRRVLPHGPPMVLVDEVEWLDPGRALRAVKRIGADEPCFKGSAGGRLAYPASLLLESFGQAAALLWHSRTGRLAGHGQVLMLAAGRHCCFSGPAYPGDVVRHRVELEQVVADTAFATGASYAGDRLIATVGSLIAVVRPAGVLGA